MHLRVNEALLVKLAHVIEKQEKFVQFLISWYMLVLFCYLKILVNRVLKVCGEIMVLQLPFPACKCPDNRGRLPRVGFGFATRSYNCSGNVLSRIAGLS